MEILCRRYLRIAASHVWNITKNLRRSFRSCIDYVDKIHAKLKISCLLSNVFLFTLQLHYNKIKETVLMNSLIIKDSNKRDCLYVINFIKKISKNVLRETFLEFLLFIKIIRKIALFKFHIKNSQSMDRVAQLIVLIYQHLSKEMLSHHL